MWLGRAGEVDLEGSECCLGALLILQEQGLEVVLVLPRSAQHLGQVTLNGDDASYLPGGGVPRRKT